jgi:hypothetical protein
MLATADARLNTAVANSAAATLGAVERAMTQQTRAAESRTAAQVLRARSEAASHAASLAAGAEANAV